MRPLSDLLTGGYAQTRQQARAGDDRALDEVARQFEAYFLQQMLKSMRDASFGDPLFGSETSKFYQEMMDQQLSLTLSSGQGIGFAKVLKSQIGGYVGAGDYSPRENPDVRDRSPDVVAGDNAARAGELGARARLNRVAGVDPMTRTADTGHASPRELTFGSPEAFVESLWPHAKRAGAALNVSPQILLAQSALETGWGKHVMSGPHGGKSSHNLFGIKAGQDWDGPRVAKRTVEYDGGVMKRVVAPFRAYSSAAESFDDYVRFIQTNARYRDALVNGPSPEAYIRGLQDAGYATDPEYADKVLGLLQREPIRHPRTGS